VPLQSWNLLISQALNTRQKYSALEHEPAPAGRVHAQTSPEVA